MYMYVYRNLNINRNGNRIEIPMNRNEEIGNFKSIIFSATKITFSYKFDSFYIIDKNL